MQIDQRAAEETPRDAPTGYTGLEGLLNYAYYQAGATNQFDSVSHLLHFSLFTFQTGPCGSFSSGGEQGSVPSEDGGETNDILEAARCVAWLGPNQPRLAGKDRDFSLPPYHPSVCLDGSNAPELCDPKGSGATSTQARRNASGGGGNARGGEPGTDPAVPPALTPQGGGSRPKNGRPKRPLDDILGIPKGKGRDLPGLGELGGGGREGGGGGEIGGLLDFLFRN